MTMRELCFDGEECSQLLSGLNDPPGTLNSQPKPKLNELSSQWTSLQVHLIWFVSKMCVHEYITEGRFSFVCCGRLLLQVQISLAVQLLQGPELTHPPLLLLPHRICKIWWAFQITAGTLMSTRNLPLRLLCDSLLLSVIHLVKSFQYVGSDDSWREQFWDSCSTA